MDVIEELFELDKELQKVIQRKFACKEYPPTVFLSGSAVEVGTLCRSLPQRTLEVEYDVMFTIGEITKEIGEKYLREVRGHVGYFHLLPSTTGEYLSAKKRDCLQHPNHYTKEWFKCVSVFTDNY